MAIDLKEIKNIIFDLGGVILNIDYNLTAKAFKNIGFTDFNTFYSQQKQADLFDQLETGKISSSQFTDVIQSNFATKTSKSDIISAWNQMLLDLPQERIELIRELAKNYKVFLLSNTNSIHYEAFTKIIEKGYETDLFKNLFVKTYYSHEIGLRKPNKDCFEYVLVQNNLKAIETLFIDDSEQHLIGAKSIGLATHHLTNGETINSLFSGYFFFDIIYSKSYVVNTLPFFSYKLCYRTIFISCLQQLYLAFSYFKERSLHTF